MKIVITKEDVDKAGKFTDMHNCPLAKVMQRELNIPGIHVGIIGIFDDRTKERIGSIHPPFHAWNMAALANVRMEEFVTEYTPL